MPRVIFLPEFWKMKQNNQFDKDKCIDILYALRKMKIPTTFKNVAKELDFKVSQLFYEITEHYKYNFVCDFDCKEPYVKTWYRNEFGNISHPETMKAVETALEKCVCVNQTEWNGGFNDWIINNNLPWVAEVKYDEFWKETGISKTTKIATSHVDYSNVSGYRDEDAKKVNDMATAAGWEILPKSKFVEKINEAVKEFMKTKTNSQICATTNTQGEN